MTNHFALTTAELLIYTTVIHASYGLFETILNNAKSFSYLFIHITKRYIYNI